MNLTLIKAVIKARRKGLLHLAAANQLTRVDCLKNKCALCCKTLGSPLVKEAETKKIPPDSLIKVNNAAFIKSENCTCCLLKDGHCLIYENRPRGCREYPWYNIDGKLYYDSGCPGIKQDLDQRPDVNDIQPFENFFPDTPKLLLWLIKKICVQ
jgi:Fe-S-cluster containining protein